jgi:zinc transport system substrate-binding protein
MKKILPPLLIVFAVFFGVYFLNQKEVKEEKEVLAVASFYPLFDLTSKIGGERVEVINLTPYGVDPHEFEPSLKDISNLEKADLFLYNGAGLDPWAEKKEEELEEKKVVVLNMSSYFNLLKGDHHTEEDHHNEDPHIWLDPLIMKEMINIIFNSLIEIDPLAEEYYRKNAEETTLLFEELNQEYEEGLSDCRLNKIVISHASIGYLAKRYNFEMIAISGISPIEEPSAKKMAEITDTVKKNKINHIFFETTIPSSLAEIIAKETDTEVLVFNPVASLTKKQIEEGEDYFSVMRDNLTKLKTALDCK